MMMASVSFATRSIVARSAPLILMPTGVRMPVESMSRRPLIGMVHALEMPGSWSFAFISFSSSSCEMRSRQIGLRMDFSHSGAHDEYQRGFSRHSDSGFRMMVVSIIVNGPGRWRCWRGRPCRTRAPPRGRS